jgi:hypothetical protein
VAASAAVSAAGVRGRLQAANNYANSLLQLRRFEEAKSIARKTMPVARRVLGESHVSTVRIGMHYAKALYQNDCPTLDDLREAVTTLEEIEPIARRVLGSAHPTTAGMETTLRNARAALRARETPATA